MAHNQHHLPPQPTSFIGRAEKLAEITALIDDPACRLLTLVGPGGIGKTRLAIEAAGQMAEDFPNGVHFVPLQPLTGPDQLLTALAQALSFQFYSESEPQQQLLNYLREKRTLPLLNFSPAREVESSSASQALVEPLLQPRDRRRADRRGRHGQEPCVSHLPEAGCSQPHRGRAASAGAWVFRPRSTQTDGER